MIPSQRGSIAYRKKKGQQPQIQANRLQAHYFNKIPQIASDQSFPKKLLI